MGQLTSGNEINSVNTAQQGEPKGLPGQSTPALAAEAPPLRPDAELVTGGETGCRTVEAPRSKRIEPAKPPLEVEVEEANRKGSGAPYMAEPIDDSAISRESGARQSELTVRGAPVSLERSRARARSRMNGEHNRGKTIKLEPSLIRTPEGQAAGSTIHIGTIEVRVINTEPPRPPVISQPVEPRSQARAAGPSRSNAQESLARGLQSRFGLRQG